MFGWFTLTIFSRTWAVILKVMLVLHPEIALEVLLGKGYRELGKGMIASSASLH